MEILKKYAMRPFAIMRLVNGNECQVEITDDNGADIERGIYAWVIGGQIARIGSNKNTLRSRTMGTGRWITMRLQKITKVSNPNRVKAEYEDAMRWKTMLDTNGLAAETWGRVGTIVTTPVGDLNTYLAEENLLLERHKPPLNNSHFR